MAQLIFIALISAGAITAIQGFLTLRGKRRAQVTFIERPLIDALAVKEEAQVTQVLGRLRVVYGLFLIAVGIWGVTGL